MRRATTVGRLARHEGRGRKGLALMATTALTAGLLTALTPAASGEEVAAGANLAGSARSSSAAGLAVAPVLPQAAPEVPGRGNTTLNMFQWTWNAIADECTTTIGPAGFAYVQTSPPHEHIQGQEWWTSYQPVSYQLESKLGSRAEFQNMVDTCGDAGVQIIADAVINHMTGTDVGSGTGVGGSSFGIDDFPGLYGPDDFNECRENISNYGDRYDVQFCRLVSLQDLKTGSDHVRDTIAGYLNDMIDMGVAGFRIDAAKHMPAEDLEAIKSKLNDPNVFWVHEVIGAGGEPVQPSEYLGSGDSHEFDYGRRLMSNFDGQISNLRNIGEGLLPSDRAGVFVDNHDTERNGETMNYKFGAKYTLANVFMLAHDYGWPSVYTGYTFDDTDAGAPGADGASVPDADCSNSAWTCVQRWTEIKGMVGFRNAVAGTSVSDWWDDGDNHIAFGRDDKGFVVINNGEGSVSNTYQTSLPAGQYCDVVASDDCSEVITVDNSGQFSAQIPAYGALAIHQGTDAGEPGPGEPDPGEPDPGEPDPGEPDPGPGTGLTRVFYSTDNDWSEYFAHYQIGSGEWTQAPGHPMAPACSGWVVAELEYESATTGTIVFNDGAGTWDNNNSADYEIGSGSIQIAHGQISEQDPCAA